MRARVKNVKSSIVSTKDCARYEKTRACGGKVSFDSENAVYRKGQEIYRCDYCDNWHRRTPVRKKALVVVKLANHQYDMLSWESRILLGSHK